MDTITHGIAGALLGKALFGGDDLITRRPMNRARIVTWALMAGAIFPDSDMIREFLSKNDMLIITWHRSITHSMLCLPIFAVALALAAWCIAQWLRWETPALSQLIGIFAVGIASHIFLDLVTTFGTMIWSPVEWSRPAWDLLFIVDFSFTGILLIPQLLEWVNRDAAHAKRRALLMWIVIAPSPFLIAAIGRIVGAPISDAATLIASLIFSLLFLLPAFRGWGSRVSQTIWTRAGLAVACIYLCAVAYAHHLAVKRVEQFMALENVQAESYGALPLPPSLLVWDGLVRTSRGVYDIPIDLSKASAFATATGAEEAAVPASDTTAINYRYVPDAPQNIWIAQAKQLPEVQKVLWFARFPVTRFRMEGGMPIVEISDLRFPKIRPDRPGGFTYQVQFTLQGAIASHGWVKR